MPLRESARMPIPGIEDDNSWKLRTKGNIQVKKEKKKQKKLAYQNRFQSKNLPENIKKENI